MATIINDVKTLQIRNAENGDFDLNLRECNCDYLEDLIYNAYPTESETGNPIYFDDGADSVPVKELIVNLEPKQEGSGDPSPSNVREISGYDGVSVKRTGKNLLDVSTTEIGTAWNGASNPARARTVIPCKPSTTYTLSINGTNGLDSIFSNDGASVPLSGTGASFTKTKTFTTSDTSNYIVIAYNKSSITQSDIDALKLQLELGSTATDYEPYQGQEYSITFPSSVGTVYSGRLNVTTGELKVDRLFNRFTSAELYGNYGTDNKPLYSVTKEGAEIVPYWYTGQSVELISNYFVKNSTVSDQTMKSGEMRTNASSNPTRFYFRWDDANSLAEVNSAFATTPLQIVAELATPTTVQLTPTEVSTLLGSNTISSDGSINLTYRADTTKVIEKLTNAIVSLGGNV